MQKWNILSYFDLIFNIAHFLLYFVGKANFNLKKQLKIVNRYFIYEKYQQSGFKNKKLGD